MSIPTQVQRWARVLQRKFAITGHLPLEVMEEVQASIDLFEGPPELCFLRGERRYAANFAQAALVGNFGQAYLECALPGSHYTVVERVWNAGVACRVGIFPAITIGAAGVLAFGQDSRQGTSFGSVTARSVGATAVSVAPIFAGSLLVILPPGYSSWGWTLFPGSRLVFETAVANQALDLTLEWREAPFITGEEQP